MLIVNTARKIDDLPEMYREDIFDNNRSAVDCAEELDNIVELLSDNSDKTIEIVTLRYDTITRIGYLINLNYLSCRDVMVHVFIQGNKNNSCEFDKEGNLLNFPSSLYSMLSKHKNEE